MRRASGYRGTAAALSSQLPGTLRQSQVTPARAPADTTASVPPGGRREDQSVVQLLERLIRNDVRPNPARVAQEFRMNNRDLP